MRVINVLESNTDAIAYGAEDVNFLAGSLVEVSNAIASLLRTSAGDPFLVSGLERFTFAINSGWVSLNNTLFRVEGANIPSSVDGGDVNFTLVQADAAFEPHVTFNGGNFVVCKDAYFTLSDTVAGDFTYADLSKNKLDVAFEASVSVSDTGWVEADFGGTTGITGKYREVNGTVHWHFVRTNTSINFTVDVPAGLSPVQDSIFSGFDGNNFSVGFPSGALKYLLFQATTASVALVRFPDISGDQQVFNCSFGRRD